MLQSERIVIFDLDGTIYQNTVFHTDYIHTLVTGTEFAHWERDLIGLADDIFAGGKLHMNRFYRMGTLRAHSCAELAAGLEQQLCQWLTYEQALERKDVLYLGDAWAVMDLLGTALGCLDKKRSDEIYHRIRHHMEQAGMHGNSRLRQAIIDLQKRCRVILVSNSYQETVDEFLRQLGFSGVFQTVCYSARKPSGMIESLGNTDPALLQKPQNLISIGDHAFNDLMPIAALGGETVWMNPYSGIDPPPCDRSFSTLDELACYLDTL